MSRPRREALGRPVAMLISPRHRGLPLLISLLSDIRERFCAQSRWYSTGPSACCCRSPMRTPMLSARPAPAYPWRCASRANPSRLCVLPGSSPTSWQSTKLRCRSAAAPASPSCSATSAQLARTDAISCVVPSCSHRAMRSCKQRRATPTCRWRAITRPKVCSAPASACLSLTLRLS